jgi:hypothetical protein
MYWVQEVFVKRYWGYYTLDMRKKLHFCMRKLMQTGDVYEERWYREGNMKDQNEKRCEREVGDLPDDYRFEMAS